jgi:hypothetical protein
MSGGMKFKCASAEHSRVIQEWLFSQGYSWCGSNSVQNTEQRYLFAYEDDKHITHDNFDQVFDRKPFVEQVVTTTTKTVLVIQSVTPKRDKVVVFGKTYYKDDVDAALAKLEVARV